MGDIIGAIFGTSQGGKETTTPDPIARALNEQRYREYLMQSAVNPLWQFGQPGPADIYTTPGGITDLQSITRNALLNQNYNIDQLMAGLQRPGDYASSFQPLIDRTNAAQQYVRDVTGQGR